MRIFSYFSPVKELNFEDEFRLMSLWNDRWRAIGFDPYVLQEWQARKHPYFEEFDAAVSKLPTTNPKTYELACYHRHLALAQVGGGWMLDHDVFPRASKEEIEEIFKCLESPFKIQILQTPCCPAVLHASAEMALFACKFMAEVGGEIGQDTNNPRPHVSDQYVFESLHMKGHKWIEIHDIVKLWSDKGWEKAPMLHFANCIMSGKGMTPRYQHIPNLLKS